MRAKQKTTSSPATRFPTVSQVPTGTVFGGYRITKRLASGASGAVVEAVHMLTKRRIAIKLPNPDALGAAGEQAHAQAVALLTHEAELLGRIDHPRVVTVFAAGVIGVCPYLALRLITGGDLIRDVQRQGPWNESDVFQLVADTADGLAAIHEAKVLHRDLKPANLLIDVRRRPVIIDFGIAIDEGERAPVDGSAIEGTPNALAPEVAMGGRATRISDVYGLGTIAWYALTGRMPYEETHLFNLLARLSSATEVPNIRAQRPGLSQGMVELVDSLLAPDPTQRITSALEVGEVCRRLLAGHESGIKRPRRRSQTSGRQRRSESRAKDSTRTV